MAPKPKTVSVICTECGIDWNKHKTDSKGKVGLEECVRLLKAELQTAKSRSYAINYATSNGVSGTTDWRIFL